VIAETATVFPTEVAEVMRDAWLSVIFGYTVFRIDLGAKATISQRALAEVCRLLQQHVHTQSTAMYYTKIDTTQVDTVRRLNAIGLYVVETNVTLSIEQPAHYRFPMDTAVSPLSIVDIQPEHYADVLGIAASCFQYSRFHLDPAIPNTVAHRVKHDWVLNYIRGGRGERLMVALVQAQPVGFLAVLRSEVAGKCIRTIDLIGVSGAFQGRGVGQQLVRYFIQQYHQQSDRLQVGTQVANTASLRLYQKLGFSTMKSTYVMHLHV
jgi:ribosomal protein S18 acetylase RimI-like enzyme